MMYSFLYAEFLMDSILGKTACFQEHYAARGHSYFGAAAVTMAGRNRRSAIM